MMLGSFPLNRLVTMMGDAMGDGFVEALLGELSIAGAGSAD